MVPPRRMYDQIGNFVKNNATTFFMLNLSDLRPVPLSTLAAMTFAWNASPFMTSSPVVTEAQFFSSFAQDKYVRFFLLCLVFVLIFTRLGTETARLQMYFKRISEFLIWQTITAITKGMTTFFLYLC